MHVQRTVRKDCDGIDVRRFDQFFERVIGLLAFERFGKALTAVFAQIADGDDFAVGMFMPVEGATKPAAHDTNADFLGRCIHREGVMRSECRCGQSQSGLGHERPARNFAAGGWGLRFVADAV